MAVLICILAAVGLFYPDKPKSIFAAQQGNSEKEEICFNWAFGAIVGKENDPKLVSIKHDTALKTGDQFKMMVELKKKCFVYLIHSSGQGEIQLLFPNGIKQFSDNYKTSKKYYIPQGDFWFALDKNIGQETFYLLASAKRLPGLETLLHDYESADSKNKPEFAAKILTKIRKIKRLHNTLTAAAERPVPMGGDVRGKTKNQNMPFKDVASLAVEIIATDFYSRTFTIEHQ